MSVVSLLHEHPVASVEEAIVAAMARGTDDSAAIALLLRQQTQPSPRTLLNLATRPDVPSQSVELVDLQAWALDSLVEGAS